MSRNIEVNVKLTVKDYADFNYSHFARKLGGSLTGLKAFCICVSVLIVAALLTLLLPGSDKYTPVLYILAGVLGFVDLFIIMLFINIGAASRMGYKNDKSLQTEHQYVFSSECILISAEGTNTSVSWDSVKRVECLKNCYALFLSAAQAYIVPKRLFQDTAGTAAFEEILTAAVPDRRIYR